MGEAALNCIRQVPGATELVTHWHCVTASVEQVQEWGRHLPNLYLGVTALSLRAEATRRALREHDPSRLLLESDAAYLVPSGAGEGPNTPWPLGHVLRELASLRGEDPGQLAIVLNDNARRVYPFQKHVLHESKDKRPPLRESVFEEVTVRISGHGCIITKHSTDADCTGLGLTSIPRDLPPTLVHLDVSHNPIRVLRNGSFKHLIHLDALFLEDCSLTELEPQAFDSSKIDMKPTWIFLLSMFAANNITRTYGHRLYSLSTHLGTRINNFTLPQSLKVINISYFTAQNIDIDDTFLIENNRLKVLDITGTKLDNSCRQVLKGLYKLKHLNVSRLQCSSLSKDFFRNYTSLEELVFRSSHLDVGLTDEVSMDLLSGLSLLKYVDFSGNKLTNLQDNVFTSQRDVLKSLTLADNRLTGVPNNIKYLTNLSVLDLTSNVISSLGEHERLMLETHRTKVPNFRVLLKGNPFECSCQTVNFIEWIYTTKLALDDPNNYMCTDRSGVNMKIVSIYNKLSTFRETCVDRTWLIFSICASILFVLVLVTVAVGYRYRVSINYCCLVIRRRYRGYHNIEGDTTQYKYDAFVSYNFEDYKFVCNDLMDHVEREMNLKLCLHHRDFTPAVDITDNIMDAISESKWIIIVITKSFLSSTWGQFEIEMSRRHMFQRNSSNLIVIMLDDIDKVKMPRKLFRIYNQITCLEHPGRNTYLQWKDSDYDVGDDHLFWVYLQNTLLS
ncbi:toll-like receptor 4 [Pecten maximus]|uniref:toll-like receptor 4 n=1 Tax=Pecten maximus TaxID=6579 RepID=UPI001458DF4D|nr:toll-like receptor 4 [Pecten maximus]